MNNNQLLEFIEESRKHCEEVYDKKNILGAAYLSMIFGMRIHSLKLANNLNPFSLDYNSLYMWFNWGFDCSKEAVKQSDILRRSYKEYEDEQDRLNKKKKSFWTFKK